METLQVFSYQRSTLLTVLAGLDPPTEACWSTTNTASHTSLHASSVSETASRGNDVQGFQKFPGIEQRDAGQSSQTSCSNSFWTTQELKVVYTRDNCTYANVVRVYSFRSLALPPSPHWKQMAKANRSGGDNLSWKTEFAEQCQAAAERNWSQQVLISFDILTNEGIYWEKDEKLNFGLAGYA